MMEYKGYIGKVEFDDEAGIFFGEVINMRDVITFEGDSVEGLRTAFRDSVDDYLDFCTEANPSNVQNLQALLKETQSLPHVGTMTEDEILSEVAVPRNRQ